MIAWCFFDWANSSFSTVITTFIFATYFSEKIAPNKILGMAYWGDAVAIAGLLIAILSPVFGAIADNEGRRKPWLFIFTYIAVIASILLWYAKPNHIYIVRTLSCFIIGTIGIEIGMVFYNAMLRNLVSRKYIGRVSGWAWGLGYFGGLLCLILSLFLFIVHGERWFGLNKLVAQDIRITGPFVGLWLGIFALPLFFLTKDQPSKGIGFGRSIRLGLSTLFKTLKQLKKYREIVKFLIARMLYIDGLNTIFAFGGIYAAGTFHMAVAQVIEFGIVMNLAAGFGAITFAWLDDIIGPKVTILIALCIMICGATGIVIVHEEAWFWFLAVLISLTVGPVQAASRSMMIRLAPEELITEMFGLYALSGKATAFIAPWLLGMMTILFNNQRIGIATILVFLVAGGLILTRVKVTPDP